MRYGLIIRENTFEWEHGIKIVNHGANIKKLRTLTKNMNKTAQKRGYLFRYYFKQINIGE